MGSHLRIAHLFPDLLNLYADKGNIATLRKRCEWRDIPVSITQVGLKDELRLQDYDLVLLGGGSDREQEIVSHALHAQRMEWKAAVADGLPLLAICGGYQLLGSYYQLGTGHQVEGLGILDLVTTAGPTRRIGNIGIATEEMGTVVGFENHGGWTTHQHAPLGTVLKGYGNNGTDGSEGVRYKNIFGTYIHGPLLPKNPRFADYVLQTALNYANLDKTLLALDDRLEHSAHTAFLKRRLSIETDSPSTFTSPSSEGTESINIPRSQPERG
jgi:CobQ-like glutamine amidotransferase family enzyme